MGKIIGAIIIIFIGLICAFIIGAFIARVANAVELPQEMTFLSELPVLAQGDCLEKATEKHYFCEYKIDIHGNSYLLVWDETKLHEVVMSNNAGIIETIFKAAKKLKL